MVLALSEAGQRAAALGVAAGVALAAWLVLLAVLAVATRPDLPRAAPAGHEIPGDQSPAVVSFLVNRWEVGHEAVPATLLDMAARKAVAIEQVAPERFVCRVSSKDPGGLADYERQVLDHVRSLASNGVVPCEALTTGPEAQSEGWWDRFEKSVVADARAHRLSRSRWGSAAIAVLAVAALVPAGLAAGAFAAIPSKDRNQTQSSSKNDNPAGAIFGLGLLGWGALMVLPFSLRAERDTPEGKAAAAKWLGLRDYLHGDEAFDRAPPSAVAIWDRYLAYGAAMGVAAGAVRALPLGSESDRVAWSAYGGGWHVVRVRYPNRIPPGWGQHPFKVTLKALFVLAVAVFVVRQLASPLATVVRDAWHSARVHGWTGPAWGAVAVGVVLLAALALFLVRSAVMLVLAVPDLFTKQQVEGMVVRLRNGYLAVDDGEHRRVRAWRVESVKMGGVARGSVVRVTVSPRLGHVFAIDHVGSQPERAGLAAAPVDVAADPNVGPALAASALAQAGAARTVTTGPDLDLDAIAASTGIRLQKTDGVQPPALPGADRAWVLTDGGKGRVMIFVSSDHHGQVPGAPDMAGTMMRWVSRGGQAVDGLEGATWVDRRSMLTLRRGDRQVTVVVGLPDVPAARRLDVAKALAATVI